ncbi:MAG TPA: hypothetical protein VEV63_09230 [Streptosporangiaceae bacterium]|nr:hypothetical protein [Streptosporangiaceae bacterium]
MVFADPGSPYLRTAAAAALRPLGTISFGRAAPGNTMNSRPAGGELADRRLTSAAVAGGGQRSRHTPVR